MENFEFKITHQGDVKMLHTTAYLVKGGDEAVCFNIDPIDRAHVTCYGQDGGFPEISLTNESDDCLFTVIKFPGFEGWSVHSWVNGETISVALTKDSLIGTL